MLGSFFSFVQTVSLRPNIVLRNQFDATYYFKLNNATAETIAERTLKAGSAKSQVNYFAYFRSWPKALELKPGE
jgi:hypothetical protein